MNEQEIKEMHEHARKLLQEEKSPYVSAYLKQIARNYFKRVWWGIEPEEALKIGGGV